MMTVKVFDADGREVHSVEVDPGRAGTNADEADLGDVERALYIAAPEVCPWDCDVCRS